MAVFNDESAKKRRKISYQRGGRRNWRGRGNYYRGEQRNVIMETGPGGSRSAEKLPFQCDPISPFGGEDAIGPCGYQGWKLYFPCKDYDEESDILKKLQVAEKYLTKIVVTKRRDIEAQQSFTIDVKTLHEDTEFGKNWPDFANDLRNMPQQVISCFGLAMHQILKEEKVHEFVASSPDPQVDPEENFNTINELPMICARFIGLEPLMPFKHLKAHVYKKFVSIKGTVVRVGNVKPLCTKLAFTCLKCKSIQLVFQPCGVYTMPNRCISKPCFSRNFTPLRNSALNEKVPWQTIRLQEITLDDQSEGGRVPRTVECELVQDLVDRCVPGDIVTVSGIVKVNDVNEKRFGSVKNKATFLLYILANSIKCLREKNSKSEDVMPGGVQLNLVDLYTVREIHGQQKLFRLLVASLCPSIYGHEAVKAGLILGLFGGTHRFQGESNKVPVRGDSHILIVGDPGLGKSHMLLACANVSPRGVYVCGNTTTSSGLTVTMTKDASGDNALEAGALVLADQGCCCIDEFDKMTNQHHALLEAMEQQTISIAKGGMFCILPARTSIIAAANPVGGHYNKAKTVSENLMLGSALLSRFDLVFIVVDRADKTLDSKLSAHVMAMHTGRHEPVAIPYKKTSSSTNNPFLDNKNKMIEKLRFGTSENPMLISPDKLKKYIAYARKYVHPKLSLEACSILKNFYVELRKQHQTAHSTPITNRQLESLIRLTEARARIELREVCSAEDAKEIVDIMKYSMVDTYSDEFGVIDFERSVHGSGMSKRSKAKRFMTILSNCANRTGTSLFTFEHMVNLAKESKLDTSCFMDFIETLNNQGFLLKKGPKLYQLQTI